MKNYIYKVYFTMLRSLLALSILCLFVIYSFNSSNSCKWVILPLFRSQSLVHTLFFFAMSVAATVAVESKCSSSLSSVDVIPALHVVSARLRAAFRQNPVVCGRFRRLPGHLRSGCLSVYRALNALSL